MAPSLDEHNVQAFLDGLELGRLEGMRLAYDFPTIYSPGDEHVDGWPYPDEDDATA